MVNFFVEMMFIFGILVTLAQGTEEKKSDEWIGLRGEEDSHILTDLVQ